MWDLDELFAFKAPKRVIIRDRRLGLLQYMFMVSIMIYIVIFGIFKNCAYLEVSEVSHIVRFELLDPTKDGCEIDEPDCKVELRPMSQLPYCCSQNSSCTGTQKDHHCQCDYAVQPLLPCSWSDAVSSAVVREKSIVIGTKVKREVQSRKCQNSDAETNSEEIANDLGDTTTCSDLWDLEHTSLRYIANIEEYRLLIDHSFSGVQGGAVPINSRDVAGRLFVGNLNGPPNEAQKATCLNRPDAEDVSGKLTNNAPCYIPPRLFHGFDIYSMAELLGSMGIDMDDITPFSDKTYREEGINVDMLIDYNDMKPWFGKVNTTYTYFLTVVPHSYGEAITFEYDDESTREKKDLLGIRFNVRPGGQLSQVSFDALIEHLTESLALLATAAVLVKLLAKYMLHNSHYYKELLTQTSPDFEYVSHLETSDRSSMSQTVYIETLKTPKGWSKEKKILTLLDRGYRAQSA